MSCSAQKLPTMVTSITILCAIGYIIIVYCLISAGDPKDGSEEGNFTRGVRAETIKGSGRTTSNPGIWRYKRRRQPCWWRLKQLSNLDNISDNFNGEKNPDNLAELFDWLHGDDSCWRIGSSWLLKNTALPILLGSINLIFNSLSLSLKMIDLLWYWLSSIS